MYTLSAIVAGSVAMTSVVAGQATLVSGNTYTCAKPNANYCAADSLQGNIIIRCNGTTGTAGNCNDNLAGIPPRGVKDFAPCWQSSPTAGDADCSYDGKVYKDDGSSFPIPGASSSAMSMTSSSASASSTMSHGSLVAVTVATTECPESLALSSASSVPAITTTTTTNVAATTLTTTECPESSSSTKSSVVVAPVATTTTTTECPESTMTPSSTVLAAAIAAETSPSSFSTSLMPYTTPYSSETVGSPIAQATSSETASTSAPLEFRGEAGKSIATSSVWALVSFGLLFLAI